MLLEGIKAAGSAEGAKVAQAIQNGAGNQTILIFGLVFLFLWKQSRIVFFGLWSAAWGLQALALFFGYQLLRTGNAAWLAPYSVFEFAFAILLMAAARAGFFGSVRDWRTVLRLISILPSARRPQDGTLMVAITLTEAGVALIRAMPDDLRAAYFPLPADIAKAKVKLGSKG